MKKMVSVGIVGSSWWADAMYLPALENHEGANVTAVCGRTLTNVEKLAAQWQIPHVFTDYQEMIDSGLCEAIVIATPNNTHYDVGMAALRKGLHVLCEKPLAMNYAQAAEMAAFAQAQGVKTMVPFTYRFMPTARYLKELIDDGYIGKPFHLNMRYYTGYGRSGNTYNWRFDNSVAGSGALGDIASHFIYLAVWYFGQVTGVYAQLGEMVPRVLVNPAGEPYERGDDTVLLTLTFANGAHGSIHATTLAYEDTPFGQTHHMEFHGSGGTLYNFIDWDRVQRVSGAREGEGAIRELPLPDHIWGSVRRELVHDTYKDIFREEDFMTRGFITAIQNDKPTDPNFVMGAVIQRILDAALMSNREKRWVGVDEVKP